MDLFKTPPSGFNVEEILAALHEEILVRALRADFATFAIIYLVYKCGENDTNLAFSARPGLFTHGFTHTLTFKGT